MQASLSGSHWESGDWLREWHSGHSSEFPERYQGPSTSQQGLPLLTSHLEGHPHLEVQEYDALFSVPWQWSLVWFLTCFKGTYKCILHLEAMQLDSMLTIGA